jgi:NADH-quinone oxidoreductase subunit L
MGGEQDMRKMGGLKKHLPATYKTFVIGSLAIAGIPPFAGFFSKDEILGAAAGHGAWVLYAVGLLTAGLTAFYMFRAVYMTFWGEFRGTHEQEHHLHESPPSMTVPLWVLAVGAILAGFVGLPKLLGEHVNLFHGFSDPIVYKIVGHPIAEHEMSLGLELLLMGVAIGVAILGIVLAGRLYGPTRGLATEEAWERRFPALHRLLSNKYYVDELYDRTVIRGTWGLARLLYRFDAGVVDGLVNGARNLTVMAAMISGFFDKYVVDGLVNLTATILDAFSKLFRRLQTGYVSNYALVLAAGMFALVVVYMILHRG